MNAELSLIGYCGLNCAKCFVYKKAVSEAAKGLRREMRAARLKESWAGIPFLGEYEPFKKSLDGLAALRCTKACRGGGGNPWCKIRKCATNRAFAGCWECTDFEACPKLAPAYLKNLKRIRLSGIVE